MLKSRVTQNNVKELLNLVSQYGYWSEQVAEYNSQFDYVSMTRLQEKAQIELMKVNPAYRLRG